MSENTNPDSPEKQEDLLRVAAEAGDTQAMDKLGELLEDRGEIFEAEAWYRKAAELGNNSAMNDLGLMFEGRKEFTEAEHWFLLSANNGNVRGMNNLAIFYEDRGRPVEAESWYRKAGDLGFPAAVNNLGFLLSNQGRSDEAKEQYLKAIDLGHEKAMINLAITHANLGEVQDAERWYRKALAMGNVQAMTNLAILLKDRGDLAEAEQLLLQGIALNSNKAMNNLAQMCIERGDLAEAEKWFLKSIEVENNTFAVNGLARVREEMAKSATSAASACTNCGTKRPGPDSSFCEECGTKFEPWPAENPLAKDPQFGEAVRRFEAWVTKYKPLCFVDLAAVNERLPSNLSGHIWTEYSWNLSDLIETGYKKDPMVMGYVVTETPAPAEQTTLLEKWIKVLCNNCGGLGVEEDGSSCVTCAGFLEYEFTVPYEFPLALNKWEEVEAFSASFQPQTTVDTSLDGPLRLPKKFDEDYWEDTDFYNIASIIWNFQFEASNQDRESLQWRSDEMNPVDTFLEKYQELFEVTEKYIEGEINLSEVDSDFAEQVSTCWNDLCSLYRYQGNSTFDGDFDEFLDFFNVLHYNDMGLSVQSEIFTIFGGKKSSD